MGRWVVTWALLGSLLITLDFARAVAVTSARSSDGNANTNTSPPAPDRSLAAAPRKRRAPRIVGRKQLPFPDENMISIAPRGGLGNQLFQIWTLIHTANKENLPFYIEDQPAPPTSNPSRYPRVFYWETFLNELKVFVRKRYNAHATYTQQGFAYTPLVLSKNKTIRLNGSFQSYKYFEESKEKIYDFLHITEKKDEVSNGFPEKFFDNTISMHFRIGDYKGSRVQQLQTIDFYMEALNKLIQDTKRSSWRVIYFYEASDRNEVNSHIKRLKEEYPHLVFESIGHDLADWEQMLVMSLCQHNIIANSSFSWWGAYLNMNLPNVYYPSKWFSNKKNSETDDLCPDHWIEI